MVHDLELLDKDALHGFHIAERHRRVLQQAVGYLRVNNLVDELADTFLRMFFEAARSGFDGIGHHDDCGLFRERIRTWIGEERIVYRAVRILVLIGIVEIQKILLQHLCDYLEKIKNQNYLTGLLLEILRKCFLPKM